MHTYTHARKYTHTHARKHMYTQAWDNDGEFLLIEAAYALPKWLKPESAANRVWLKEGQLHIVPLPSSKHPSLPSIPSTMQALQVGQALSSIEWPVTTAACF